MVHLRRGTREIRHRVPMTSRVVNRGVLSHRIPFYRYSKHCSNGHWKEDHLEKTDLAMDHLQSKIEPTQLTVDVELVEGCETSEEHKDALLLRVVYILHESINKGVLLPSRAKSNLLC